ncbi:MAG: transcriptional repressor LexA, partial [Firmicutes bacterium]|nr:transcriptional repressor LexA [Bacillota bacterium]
MQTIQSVSNNAKRGQAMSVMNESTILRVLECIQKRQMAAGRSPSYREIMRLCRLPSIGQVQRCIRVLKERGELESGRNGKIALDFRLSGRSVGVPLIGQIACGQPVFAVENYEGVYRLPEEWVGVGEHFMLRADGNSMTGAGIKSGDMLILRHQDCAEYGQIVAAVINDDATVKTYRSEKDKIVLHA